MRLAFPIAALLVAAAVLYSADDRSMVESRSVTKDTAGRRPVIVELFTSEGCSSCPPADALLEKLDQTQPVAGAMVIAMSEHVDYWNYIGWTDPWSSPVYSRRQQGYADHFRLQSIYTPQAVVNGEAEMVGNDTSRLKDAISRASSEDAHPITISPVMQMNGAAMVDVQVSALAKADGKAGKEDAVVFVAIAENATVSHVQRGENSGRTLRHVAVVRSLNEAGKLGADGTFHKQISLPGDAAQWSGKRLVAFVQDANFGRIRGSASRLLQPGA